MSVGRLPVHARAYGGLQLAGISSLFFQLSLVRLARAQFIAGPEFQIHTNTVGDQWFPDCAAVCDDFVIAWESTTGPPSAYGQRFNDQDNKVGPEFRISPVDEWDYQPRIALVEGGFVIAHHSPAPLEMDVFCQSFSSDGTAVLSEFLANTYTAGLQCCTRLAALPSGFVAVWRQGDDRDGSGDSVYGQAFESQGKKNGNEFRVNTYTLGDQHHPEVVGVGDGFVVAWSSFGQDGSGYGVYGQLFDSIGNKLGAEFRMNSETSFAQSKPALAALGDGFVAVWQSWNQSGSGWGAFGQLFTAAGAKIGNEFQAFTRSDGSQNFDVDVESFGEGFVVVSRGVDPTGSEVEIFGQYFGSGGQKIGGEFQVNVYTPDTQWQPRISAMSDRFVVVWTSDGAQDGDGRGVFGRVFLPQASAPTVAPTFAPTSVPTHHPSAVPTQPPTLLPSPLPTAAPTAKPIQVTLPTRVSGATNFSSLTEAAVTSPNGYSPATAPPEEIMTGSLAPSDDEASPAGIVAGVVAGLVLSGFGAVGWWRWRKRSQESLPAAQQRNQAGPIEAYDEVPDWRPGQPHKQPSRPKGPPENEYRALKTVPYGQGIAPSYDSVGRHWSRAATYDSTS